MAEPIWMEILDAVIFHDMELAAHGGSVGIRDAGMLESALARPRNPWLYADEPLPRTRLAAAYAFGVSSNHLFVDGNKRTALVISLAFLEVNGIAVTATQEDAYATFLGLAAGTVSEDEMAACFAKNTSPRA